MTIDLIKVLNTQSFYTFENGFILFKGEPLGFLGRGELERKIKKYMSISFINIKHVKKHKEISQCDFNLICFSYDSNEELRKNSKKIAYVLKGKRIKDVEDSIFI